MDVSREREAEQPVTLPAEESRRPISRGFWLMIVGAVLVFVGLIMTSAIFFVFAWSAGTGVSFGTTLGLSYSVAAIGYVVQAVGFLLTIVGIATMLRQRS
jgi:uncharacterized membrane protein